MSGLQIALGLSNLGCAALVVALSLPLVRRKVKRNLFYGVRFRRTMASDEVWYDANAYGGRRLVLWSGFVALAGVACFLVPMEGSTWWPILLGLAPLVYLIGAWETWSYVKRRTEP